MRTAWAILILMALLATGCGHVISKEVRESGISGAKFPIVQAAPEKQMGERLIWGGTVIQTKPDESGTFIEVLEQPLDEQGAVIDPDASRGRFLAFTNDVYDPMIYARGRTVTVAGTLIDAMKGHIGKREYVFPVLKIIEIHLWPERLYMNYPDMDLYRPAPFTGLWSPWGYPYTPYYRQY